jgi:hypothetical protein
MKDSNLTVRIKDSLDLNRSHLISISEETAFNTAFSFNPACLIQAHLNRGSKIEPVEFRNMEKYVKNN